jgi:hypothetical protein
VPSFQQLANFCRVAIHGGKDGKPSDGLDKIDQVNVVVGNLSIDDTTPTSLILGAQFNFTNPSKYSATVPYFNINVLVNGTHIGTATVKDMEVHPGNNTNNHMSINWDPYTYGGDRGKEVGAELLSQYISGTPCCRHNFLPKLN